MAQTILSANSANFPDETIAQMLGSAPMEMEFDIHTSALVGEILYARDEPTRWVTICEMALESFDTPVERRIALELELVNGIRRVSGRWDIERARRVLEQLSLSLQGLSEANPYRARLGVLALYHGGIVEHAGGNFPQSALCHELASVLPGVSPLARAISGFMGANEHINDALVKTGAPTADQLQRFADRDRELERILDLNAAEGRRWNINRLCFRQRVAWLTGSGMLWGDLGKIWSSCQEFGSSFDASFHVLQGAYQGGSIGPESVRSLLILAAGQGESDWRSEAMLVVAQSYHARGELVSAVETLRKILAMESQGHGGHVAHAIARRMLQGGDGK